MRLDTEFSKVAYKYPDRLAIKYGDEEYTFGEVESNSHWDDVLDIPEIVNGRFYINALAAMKKGRIAGAPIGYDVIYNDGAWLASTSATTGSAKAVVHGHNQMVKLAEADREFYRLTPDDRIGIVRTGVPAYRLGFDGLLSGTPIVVKPPDGDENSSYLSHWIRKEEITILNLTATAFRKLISDNTPAMHVPSLRILEVGGEMVDWGDVELYQKYFSDNCKFVCRYACSETHVISRYVLDKSSKIGEGRLPVGSPAKGVEIIIVGSEIIVHSPYLAIEYWHDDALTREKFKVDDATGKRWYRTGDKGWFDDDGCLHHEGRILTEK